MESKRHRVYIGASEISALIEYYNNVPLGAFSTAYSIKTRLTKPELELPQPAKKLPLEFGTKMEKYVIKYLKQEYGFEVNLWDQSQAFMLNSDTKGFPLGCLIDAYLIKDGKFYIIEIKTRNSTYYALPEGYKYQLSQQLYLATQQNNGKITVDGVEYVIGGAFLVLLSATTEASDDVRRAVTIMEEWRELNLIGSGLNPDEKELMFAKKFEELIYQKVYNFYKPSIECYIDIEDAENNVWLDHLSRVEQIKEVWNRFNKEAYTDEIKPQVKDKELLAFEYPLKHGVDILDGDALELAKKTKQLMEYLSKTTKVVEENKVALMHACKDRIGLTSQGVTVEWRATKASKTGYSFYVK